MSKLLDDLRKEEEHYRHSNPDRSNNVKVIVEHIEKLERENNMYIKVLGDHVHPEQIEFLKEKSEKGEKW